MQKPWTPADVSRRFAEAISAGDIDDALACWSSEAVIAAPDGSQVRGHAALAERFRQLIAAGAQLQISVSDQVRTEPGATAMTRMTLTVPGDPQPTVIETAAVVVYVPGPPGFQILIDHLLTVGP